MTIDCYLKNSYRAIKEGNLLIQKADRDDYAQELVNIIDNNISDFLQENGSYLLLKPDLDFRFIFAFNKTSSVVYSTKPPIVIHNTYLGHSLNILNKIYFYAENGSSIFGYQFRLLQEQFYADGLDEFAIMLDVFRKHFSMDDSFKHLIKYYPSVPHSFPQELFILVHELIHYFLSQELLDRSRYINMIHDLAKTRIDEFSGKIPPDKSSLVSDIFNFEHSDEMSVLMSKAYSELLDDDHACEEVICDILSFNFTLKHLKSMLPPVVIEESIYLLHRHLRLFDRVKTCARGAQSLEEDENCIKMVKDSLRLHLTRSLSSIDRGKDIIEYRARLLGENKMCDRYFDIIDKISMCSLSGVNGECKIADTFVFNIAKRTYEVQDPKDKPGRERLKCK